MHKYESPDGEIRDCPAWVVPVLCLVLAGFVPQLWARSLDFIPPKPEGPAKIQSSLWDMAATGQAAAKATGSAAEDTVVVTLVPYHGKGSASIDSSSFADLGVKVLAQSKSLMRVSVPASSLLAVSELPGIRFVRKPIRPHSQVILPFTEGAEPVGALANHLAGVKGQGVKVAIIDPGFKGANELPGEIPGFRWKDFTEEEEGMFAGDSVHGTACAEIIHDLAPEAELTLLKTGDLVDFEKAKDYCIREGIDIVSRSATWPQTGFGDGRGLACDIVNDASDNGILWVNSAGNEADRHYLGFWTDRDDDGWHNFEGEGEIIPLEAEEGDDIDVILVWNDWPTSSQNYDLYLYKKDASGNFEEVAESPDIQSRDSPNRPVESIKYTAQESGRFFIAVWKHENALPKMFKLWTDKHDFERYSVAEKSIQPPADAKGAMAVGAVNVDPRFWDSGRVEEYSSRGPTTDGRIKPELVAPTGVSTASYAPDLFFGTSAAAPHVAGAAALIKSANPSFTRDDLWNALIAATVDIDVSGRDNNSGYGKLVLPVMEIQEVVSPRITSVNPQRVQYGQVITIRGTGFGASRGNSKVIFHEDHQLQFSSQYVHWSDTRIQVRVPTGARTGLLQVITDGGSDTFELTVTSPWVNNISLQRRSTDILVTVNGTNFGSTRGSSSVTVGSARISSSSFSTWTRNRIRFSIPHNTRSADLKVRTSEGTSNAVPLELPGPYLRQASPNSLHPGDRLTLSGSFFNSKRGNGYVLFHSNVRPSSSDYVSWSDSRIIVKTPSRAQTGNVKVVTLNGSSGTRRIEVEEIQEPQITSVTPNRVRYNEVVTIRGTGFGATRGTGKVVFYLGQDPSSSQYVSWSDTRIQVRVPTGARTGNLQVVTAKGTDSFRLTITSPLVRTVSPRSGGANTLVTVSGSNFGSSRGTSTVSIGSTTIRSFSGWSSGRIQFRIPVNTRSGNLSVRTSNGTSNTVFLEVTSPYLSRVSPTRVKPGDRLTLTGANFRSTRGTGYVLFHPNVRPSSNDYVSWSDSRIIVKAPSRAQTGNVKVVTLNGSSGTRRIEVEEIQEPQITSVTPNRVRYNQVVTIRGTGFGATRGTGKVVFHLGQNPSSSQYVSWSDARIQVRVPTGARTGNLQVVTARGSDSFRLTITSPWVRIVSPRSGRANTLVTVTGSNFGSSRGTSTVSIGSTTIRSFSAWSSSRIQFRIPVNTRSGNLSVRTSEGTSNTVFLEVTSPYLSRVFPTPVKPGDQLTLTGDRFRSTRGAGYVLFSPNVRPASGDYVTWSDTRIVVEVPSGAESGNVKVVTLYGSSGNRHIEVEREEVEPLPSTGIFGYNPPSLTKNPKTVKFGFKGIGEDVALTWTLKNDAEVDILVNDQGYGWVPVADDWKSWWTILYQEDLNSGQNVIEFRNQANQNRSSSFTRWQLKDVVLWKRFSAKMLAGANFLGSSRPVRQTALGDPFPTPFNAGVTVPFTTAEPGEVRISVFNLMGQQVCVLHDGWTEAGTHEARWDGRTDSGTEAASGIYWTMLRTGGLAQSTRLVLIR